MQTEVGPKQLRLTALRLRLLEEGCDAVPLIDEYLFDTLLPSDAIVQPIGDGRNAVAEIVLKQLPLPDDTVSWEQIVEFREDTASRDAWVRLRRWMTELSRKAMTPAEMEDELEFLIHEFERSMELHRLRTTKGSLEAFIVGGADVLESLLKVKLRRMAEALFSARRRRIDLLQAERSYPGAAVSDILKARSAFRR